MFTPEIPTNKNQTKRRQEPRKNGHHKASRKKPLWTSPRKGWLVTRAMCLDKEAKIHNESFSKCSHKKKVHPLLQKQMPATDPGASSGLSRSLVRPLITRLLRATLFTRQYVGGHNLVSLEAPTIPGHCFCFFCCPSGLLGWTLFIIGGEGMDFLEGSVLFHPGFFFRSKRRGRFFI